MRLTLVKTFFLLITILLSVCSTAVFSQAPVITDFDPTTVCQGEEVTITITGKNFDNTTAVQLGSAAAKSFKVVDPTTITAIVADNATSGKIKVTTPKGDTTSDDNITINPAPIPELLDRSPGRFSDFANCNGSLTYTLTVENNSEAAGGSCEYDIDWGDKTSHFKQTDWQVGSQTTHTYQAQGYFKIILTITPANGCKKTKPYNFYSGGNPVGGFGSDQPTVNLCAPATVSFKITGQWYNNTPGTYYYIDWGDNSDTTLQHPLNSTNSDQVVKHTYTKTSCPDYSSFKATFKAANGCVPSNGSWDPIGIGIKPNASFKVDKTTICINDPICPNNNSSAAYSGSTLDCNSPSSYTWDFGDGGTSSAPNPVCYTYKKPGTYKLKLSATSFCGTDDTSETITVKDISSKPTVTSPVYYCQFETAVPLKATGTNLLWYTTQTGGTGSTTAPTPSTATIGTNYYYVSQTISGQCESPRAAIAVTVNAKPNPPIVATPVMFCKGVPATPLTATGTGLLWYITETGGTGSVTAPTPSTATIDTTYYYVSQTTNNCEGPRAKIEVDVIDKPAAPTVVTPVTYCQNQAATPLTATGTKLLWYTTATGGTGSSTAPTPSTAVPLTTIYYVSQSNFCGESPRASITVNVFAGPSATIAYSPSSLCNSSTAIVVPVTITGDKTGSFSISPSGLPIDASGTLSPANAAAGTYTITYTINASGGCSQLKTTTTVTVSSTPNATVIYPEICSSTSSVSPVITGTKGGTFSSDAGLVIDKATGNISPATSTVGKHTITYTIAASPPCPGFTTTADVIIAKAPSAIISYNPASLCNTANALEVSVSFSGDNGGTYTIQPSTGLPIDAKTGKLSPAGAMPNNYTITYTINASGGCAVFTTTANVSVSGTPKASIQYPPICSSDGNVPVVITGSQGGTFSSGAGLTIDKTTGAITPSASTPGPYTVKYSIAPSPPCPGFDTSTTVIITKASSASIVYQPSVLCNTIDPSNPPVNVTLTGDGGGNFSIQPPTGLLINTSSGTITPAGAAPGVYTITYTLKGTGGCEDFTADTTVTIQNTPKAEIKYPGSPYCGSSTTATVIFKGTANGLFSSSAGLSIDANTGTINPSLSKPGIYTVTYTIAPSLPCPGFDTSIKVEIAESPVISFTVSSQAVCSKETAVFEPTSTVSNTVYAWAVEGVLPPTISGVTSGTVSEPNAVINLLFINSGTTSETITIKVAPTNPAQNPCGGNPVTLTLTINPIPAPLKPDTTEICMHSPPVTLTATPDAGNTVRWYDVSNNVLSQAPVINTINPAQFVFYATQVSGFGCESPKATFIAIVHPVAKIIGSSYTNPISCGIPSGSITLQVVDLNGNQLPNIPVLVHYTKFQTQLVMKTTTDAAGKIVMPLTAGIYSGIYVETYGCQSQPIPNVFVLKDPTPPAQPIAGYNAPVCSESILNLSASSPTSSIPGPINYVWVGPAFGNSQDTTQNTVVSFPSASMSYNGTYIVYAMQNNCISPATSFQVVIKQSPTKPVINTKTPLCIGDDLNLQAFSSIPGNGTLNFTWNGPGTGFPVNAANAGIQNVKITDGGVYTVSVTSPETGCTVSTDTLIQIGGYPIVKFSQDSLNVATGYVFKLTPTILNASDPNILPISKYEWTPTQNISCNDAACSAPTIIVKNNVCYSVKATNMYGCSGGDTICITTFCKNSQVFIPNAFTPNGLAENSRFMVRASGVASIKSFRVFNRWGRVVFERNNFAPNNPAYGWDGLVNGKPADMGVYVYTVDVVCENGTPYTYKGNVTLIR